MPATLNRCSEPDFSEKGSVIQPPQKQSKNGSDGALKAVTNKMTFHRNLRGRYEMCGAPLQCYKNRVNRCLHLSQNTE